MPIRKVPLVTSEIYHIVNRGLYQQPIFNINSDYQRFFETMLYYQNSNLPTRFSLYTMQDHFSKSPKDKNDLLIEIIAYCFMPNHFHLLLRQLHDDGIKTFISKLANSYAHYFHLKNKRLGQLFQGRFNAVRIETDEQLLHVSRYIHLNPYSAHVVKTIEELKQYPYSSFKEYFCLEINNICNKELVSKHFKDNLDYEDFVLDYADSQRELQTIKHLILEEI